MLNKNIPFFNYSRIFTDERNDLIKIIDDVGSRGAFILQRDLLQFEGNLAQYLKAKYSIGVGNATDGLEIALGSIGVNKGDEIICSAHTMLATASAIKVAGGVPVAVDIDKDNLIDPSSIESAITKNTVGIMPTQLNGRVCNMDAIGSIAQKYGLYIVEDAAQALGAKFKGKMAGTFGMAAAISFFPAKLLGSLGDGGAVITNDDWLYDRMFQMHDHGRDVNGIVKSWGRNSRLDNLQAAILDFRLKSYKKIVERRREIAMIYQNELGGLDQLRLPPGPLANEDNYDVYQNYELTALRRDDLQKFLKENGVGTLIQWGGKAIHQWENLNVRHVDVPAANKFFKECIMLPMNMSLSNDDVHYVADVIKNFYK